MLMNNVVFRKKLWKTQEIIDILNFKQPKENNIILNENLNIMRQTFSQTIY